VTLSQKTTAGAVNNEKRKKKRCLRSQWRIQEFAAEDEAEGAEGGGVWGWGKIFESGALKCRILVQSGALL